MVDDKELEEKEYYRKRLRQWRDLGFDTKELEIMLETDFEHFKEMSMEKLRSQLHLMTSEETIPKDKADERSKAASREHGRTSRPFITEYDDIRKQNEDEKEDALLDIRKEMTRRKHLDETGVRDLEDDEEFATPKARPRPKAPEVDEDYPLISFNPPPGKGPARTPPTRAREEPPPISKVVREMDLLEEEALIKRKRRQLEEEEARLRRRKRLMLGQTEAEPRLGPETAENGSGEDEAALIFVDKERNGEADEEEPADEGPEEPPEDEHVRLTVVHDRKVEEPEEAEEVEALPVSTGRPRPKLIKKGPPTARPKPKVRPVKGPVRKAPAFVKKAPVPVKRAAAPVKRSRPVKPMVHKEEKRSMNPFGILVVIMVVIIVLASLLWYSNVLPTVTAVAKVSSSQVSIGQDVTFSGNGSKSSGTINSYIWDFGDGTPHASGKVVHHIYNKAGNFNATLTVKSDNGLSKTTTVVVHVAHLQVRPPSKMIGDNATYSTRGWAIIDGDLYTFHNPVPIGGVSEVKIQHIDLNYNGPMVSTVNNITSQDDGYSVMHQTLHRAIVENLVFTANATSNVASTPITIKGKENMNQQVYVDLRTNQSIKTVLSSTMQTDPIMMGPIQLSKGMTSKDDLRTYPDLATVDSQVSIEDLFAERTLNTGDPNTLHGQITKGQSPDMVTYSWKYDGTDNIYKRPAIHLNVTIDGNTMARLGLTALFVDVWITNDLPTYVKMHTYVAGQSGNNTYKADNTQDISSFKAGETKITGTCNASHYDTVHPLSLFAAFNMTPPVGDTSKSSELFSPREAMLQALNQSSGFRAYMGSGSPYAITGNYSEKSGPSWNLTFGKKGDTEGYNIIVTSVGKGSYNVYSKQVSVDSPKINRDDIRSVVTLSSAETIFHSDTKTAETVFSGNKVDYSKANWLLNADTPYPDLDFTFTSISATEIKYTYFLSKPGSSSQSSYNVALNAMDGQLMFAEEHSGSVPLPF